MNALDDARRRKAFAGAEAVGALSAMLRLGTIPAGMFGPARRIVDDYLRAEADAIAAAGDRERVSA